MYENFEKKKAQNRERNILLHDKIQSAIDFNNEKDS